MAEENQGNAQPVIIKRVKKAGHDSHHGGSWKVAYADFVTAMMAFFLLLWLLQATTEEQKLGIADYFAPTSVSRNTNGADGVMGGRTMTREGVRPNDKTPIGVMIDLPTNPPDWDAEGDPEENTATDEDGAGGAGAGEFPREETAEAPSASDELESEQLEVFLAKQEEAQFARAEEALREAIENVPELATLMNNLIIDRTEEGMRIQLVDEEGRSMFASGSAEMLDHTRALLRLVVDAVRQLPQEIAIKGHTDAKPFANRKDYSNWELSTDRANSSRRALIEAGLPAVRIATVVGMADKEHLDEDDPLSPRNRRISVILLREARMPEQTAERPEPPVDVKGAAGR